MISSTCEKVNNQQREACAVSIMRAMLEDYSDDTGESFTDAFFRFAISPTYRELFDYSTGLWKEGPDYLRNVFEDSLG